MAKWTDEQKLKALALAEASSAGRAAVKMGIPRGTILTWMRQSNQDKNQSINQSNSINQSIENQSTPKPERDNLTDKQRRFVQEYLIDLNATQAAARAGYSEKTAYSIGQENLKKPEVLAAIQGAIDERSERTKITQDMVLKELAKLGFSDMRKFTQWGSGGVRLKDSEELSDEDAACIAEVSEVTTLNGGSIKFKLHDKKGSLELLGKHLGMFHEKIDIKHSGEVKTVHEQNYNITQTIITEHPELIDRIFESGVESRRS